MAKRGPAKTPTKVLDLRGSWRAKLNPGEPQIDPTMPEKPKRLSKAAAAVWDEAADALSGAGLLTAADGRPYTRLCQLSAEFDKVQAFLDEHGPWIEIYPNDDPTRDKAQIVSPLCKLRDSLSGQILRLEAQFGMTPSARAG